MTFSFDRSQLESSFEGELEEVSGYLRQNPGLRVRIEGYTDSSGDAAYNESLSLSRAESVRDALVADGVGAERIEVGGKGEQDPLVSNDTLDNRRKNRRVEIRIIE